eukprot:4731038-Karenia_brevis.AAC.1
MRIAFVALDRPDIQYSAKEIARAMSKPTVQAEECLKRIVRYLIWHRKFMWKYPRQDFRSFLDGYADANWCSCPTTRKSTSGMVIMLGSHAIRTSATTQKRTALSVGESELYALIKTASNLIGMQSMA